MSQRGCKTSSRLVTTPTSQPLLAPPLLRQPCLWSNRASLTAGRKLKLSVLAPDCQQQAKKCCSSRVGNENLRRPNGKNMGSVNWIYSFSLKKNKKNAVTPATKQFFVVAFFQFFIAGCSCSGCTSKLSVPALPLLSVYIICVQHTSPCWPAQKQSQSQLTSAPRRGG